MILWLLACSDTGSDPADAGAQDTGVMPTPTTLEPVLAAEDIAPQIEQILAEELLLPTEVHTWSMQVLDDLEAGAGACPSRTVSEADPNHWVSFWSGECSGSRYTISGDWLVDVIQSDSANRRRLVAVEVWSIRGTVEGGAEVSASGQAEIDWTWENGLIRATMEVLGAFVDPQGTRAFQGGALPAATFDGAWSSEHGYTGALAGAIGRDDRALRFDDLTFNEGCASPAGVLGVRDPSSGWWEIALADDCSGCGPLRFGEETYGEACAGVSLKSVIDARFRAEAEAAG